MKKFMYESWQEYRQYLNERKNKSCCYWQQYIEKVLHESKNRKQ